MTTRTRATGASPSPQPDGLQLPMVLGGGALLSQVGRQLATTLDRSFGHFDVTTQQAALLLHAARKPTSPSQLTDILGTDTAGMTRLLDRLEAKGLLHRRRHAEDRRAIIIELTDTGQRLLPHLPPIFGRINTRLFDGFTAEEITACTEMLQRMLTNLGADQSS